MKAIAVIPARGGSQRLPLKNTLKVGERTLIERAVDTCYQAGFDKVVVSTDNRRIGYQASEAGADVHIRWEVESEQPSEVPYLAVLKNNLEYEVCALVQCTSPTLMPWELSESLNQVKAAGIRRVMLYATYHGEECGAFYIAKTADVILSESRWGPPGTLRTQRDIAIYSDINTASDYIAACRALEVEPEAVPHLRPVK